MNESNSIEIIDKEHLTEKTKFRLDEISKIENYCHEEINQRKSCSKKLNNYVAAFAYIDKILVSLSARSGGVSITSFTTVVGALIGIARASFTLLFLLTTGITKKLLCIMRNKKKKYDKILMSAKIKLNSIETLISHALNGMEISHE